jgi:hypothetical protein
MDESNPAQNITMTIGIILFLSHGERLPALVKGLIGIAEEPQNERFK